jgi:uncharacterized membrane protein YkoI
MKKCLTIGLLSAWTLLAVADEKVDYTQLPQPVQNTVNASKGTDTIKDIERQVKDGKTVYEVEFERTGFNPKMWIAEDGSVVRDSRTKSSTEAVSETSPRTDVAATRTATFKLNEVPASVQKTVQEHAAGRKVVDIDKETWNNRTVYEVEFAQSGRNAQLYVAEDGTIVKAEEPKKQGVGTSIFGFYLATQLEDTPLAVQETIKREAQGREIADIDLEKRNGVPVYEVEFKQSGSNIELLLAQDGSILRDSRKPEAVGGTVEGTPDTVTGQGTSKTPDQKP